MNGSRKSFFKTLSLSVKQGKKLFDKKVTSYEFLNRSRCFYYLYLLLLLKPYERIDEQIHLSRRESNLFRPMK